jgi:hypothetical protein
VADAWVGLAEAIEALRTELSGAMLFGHGEGMQFELQPIELTLQVAVSDAGNGKISWKVLEVGASRQSTSTQMMKLTLTPIWKRPDGTLVRDYTIASAGVPGDRIGPDPSTSKK